MALTKEHEELLQLGRFIDEHLGSLSEDEFQEAVTRYHELMRITDQQKKDTEK